MAERLDSMGDDPRRAARKARADHARKRVGELTAAYPAEHQGRVLSDVAQEMGVDPSTISRYVNHPEAPPGAASRPHRKPRRNRIWTDALVKEAIHAWWDRHGRAPTGVDWTPSRLRAKGGAKETRLLAWEEGFVDQAGTWHKFPLAQSVAFQRLLLEVADEGSRQERTPLPRLPDGEPPSESAESSRS